MRKKGELFVFEYDMIDVLCDARNIRQLLH